MVIQRNYRKRRVQYRGRGCSLAVNTASQSLQHDSEKQGNRIVYSCPSHATAPTRNPKDGEKVEIETSLRRHLSSLQELLSLKGVLSKKRLITNTQWFQFSSISCSHMPFSLSAQYLRNVMHHPSPMRFAWQFFHSQVRAGQVHPVISVLLILQERATWDSPLPTVR